MRVLGLAVVVLMIGGSGAAPVWAASPKKKSVVTRSMESGATIAAAIQQGKALMVQGNRKQAIVVLDRASLLTKSKAELREISAKRLLFVEQFLTSESFQDYQEAQSLSTLERWEECLRELDAVGEKDRDNLVVLRLRAVCQLGLKRLDAAEATLRSILAMAPGDLSATFELVDIAVASKRVIEGNELLNTIAPRLSLELERHVILKARLLEVADKPAEAAEVLRQDQEAHLDHVNVLYELGMLYVRLPGRAWPARKMLSLFVTRCKRLKESELRARKLDVLLPQAQAALVALDQKLGV